LGHYESLPTVGVFGRGVSPSGLWQILVVEVVSRYTWFYLSHSWEAPVGQNDIPRLDYHRERNHQGLGNQLIDGLEVHPQNGRVRRCQRVGGLLSYYSRAV
jgi:hypothetical protein